MCFEASARLQSFTAAANELHLNQGAVSRQIRSLEERLGVALFNGRRDSMTLTAAGHQYLDEIRPLLQRLERATMNVVALKGRGGSLALSVGSSVGNYWLIPRLPDFTRTHHEITLNVHTRVGPVDFGSAAIDASLEFGDGQRSGLHNDFVVPLVLAPYASPDWVARHGERIDGATPGTALIQHVTLPGAWDGWFEHERAGAHPGRYGPRYELMSMALTAAVSSMGAVLLPPYMAEDMVASGRLERLQGTPWKHPMGYYLVYPESSAGLPALDAFRTWLLKQAGN